MKQVKEDRQTYRGSLDTLNKRLIAASYLGLPTETDFRTQNLPTIGESYKGEEEDNMTKAFWEMLDIISHQEEPCNRKRMKKYTKGKPDLRSALSSAQWPE